MTSHSQACAGMRGHRGDQNDCRIFEVLFGGALAGTISKASFNDDNHIIFIICVMIGVKLRYFAPRKIETRSTMKVSKEASARHRAALLEAASRLFRDRGFEGVSIADIAAAAGLTHGAFYTHFDSKKALCVEVVERGISESAAFARAVPNRRRVEFYLSAAHAEDRAKGCAIAALSGDVAREPPEVRAAFSRSIDHLFDVLASEQPAGTHRPRDAGIVSLAARIGALVLARATTDPKLRNEILSAARRALLGPASP